MKNKIFNFQFSIFNKFFGKKAKIVVITNDSQKIVKKFISQIMPNSFKVDREILFVDNIEKANLSQIEHLILNSDFRRNCPPLEGKVPPEQFKVLTFGFQWGADFQASDLIQKNGYTNFKIKHERSIVPFWIKDSFEQKEVCSVLPAIIIGTIFGLNLIQISEKLRPHRLEA